MEGSDPDLPALSAHVDGLAHLVEQMLLLSRVGVQPTSSSDDNFRPLALSALAHQAVADWSLRANRAGVELGLQVEDEGQVSGHQALLLEALGNLIDNVIKHARGATIATITVQPDRLVVSDDGQGFREKGPTETTVQRFGLSIVEEIMDLHKGRVEKNVGANARIALIFPPSQEASE